MAARRKAPKSGGKSKLSTTVVLRQAIVRLQRIEQQSRTIYDAVVSTHRHLEAKLEEGFDRLNRRIDALEAAVRQNSEDIRKLRAAVRQNTEDIRQNSEDIQKLRAEVRQNSEDIQKLRADLYTLSLAIDRKADAEELAALESRVSALEQRVGVV